MQLAYLSQTQPQALESLNLALSIYQQAPNEQEKIFSGIRLIRIYESQKSATSITTIINDLSSSFPSNLVLAREIARLIQAEEITASPYQAILNQAANIIKSTQTNLPTEEYNKLASYYQSIIDLCA